MPDGTIPLNNQKNATWNNHKKIIWTNVQSWQTENQPQFQIVRCVLNLVSKMIRNVNHKVPDVEIMESLLEVGKTIWKWLSSLGFF